MPVGSRDDRLARTQGVGQGSGNGLRLILVGCDVDIGRADELHHLLRTNESVMKYDVLSNPQVLSEQLQRLAVFISLALSYVRMGRPRDDIRNIAVLRQNARQGLYDCFNSLIWREQAEGQQYRFVSDSEAVLVKIRINKRQVGNPMRDDVNLCRRNLEDLL